MRARRGTSEGSHARRGWRLRAWLAIASLVLQLAATAGHFHPEDFALPAAGTAALADGSAVGAPLPAGGSPFLPAHDDCSLCFSLQVVGASALAVPVALPLPRGQEAPPAPILPALRLAAPPYLLFQTRAPPIA